ncbi:Tm-1-like ATP-binding domain-containing protein [Blastopirellula sp. J2-11]|uniref:Tm-1-like ATP-binding domain-containing protein n=1 Tax=Blastopirellula sp. J2-11 TaxID=2943192 RepID=UPI0021C69E52|nr:Tm-1-like ATP-binding domain-containing protein [Blastopirellula sp. J2-11]UUO07166.1 Tm-1-like ATP-binding domain-containing protein [Blastopirellula sp. J2-11]
MAVIAVLGTLDTKGQEHAFVADAIRSRGHDVLLIDVGSDQLPAVEPDISREEVAQAASLDWRTISARHDRGECVSAMSLAAPELLSRFVHERRIDGVISLGGGGGTAIATAAMRCLPVGFPKVMVSTLASGNTAHYLGTKDIVMIPSVVDVAGLNRISRRIFAQAAGAICGMVETELDESAAKPLIVASMFGNTTQCIDKAIPALEKAGYEVLVFHATGAGGRAMESLIRDGLVDGVLDVTTTEWADELVGGVLSAGPDRLDAAALAGVPAIVAPGCLDMANFGERSTLPPKFEGRNLYIHNPQVTLMRTNKAECRELGRILAEKVNRYTAPVTVLLPLQGVSVISAPGQPFYDPAADAALFDSLTENLDESIAIRRIDANINDEEFARACTQSLLQNIHAHQPSTV